MFNYWCCLPVGQGRKVEKEEKREEVAEAQRHTGHRRQMAEKFTKKPLFY
jgi:hypothetical protein